MGFDYLSMSLENVTTGEIGPEQVRLLLFLSKI